MPARRRRHALGLLLCLALPLCVSACDNNDTNTTAPSNSAPFSQIDVRVGTGPVIAAAGDTLKANYAGWLYDGTKPDKKGVQFTSSTASGSIDFVLGAGTVIEGWDQGAVGMRAGGLRRLVVPPSMAYGSRRFGVIPPNATLVFEIELLDVTRPAAAAAPAGAAAR